MNKILMRVMIVGASCCLLGGPILVYGEEDDWREQVQAFRQAVKGDDDLLVEQTWQQLAQDEAALRYMKKHSLDSYRLFKSYRLVFRVNQVMGRDKIEADQDFEDTPRPPSPMGSVEQSNQKRVLANPNQKERTNAQKVKSYSNQQRMQQDHISNRTRALRSPNQSRRPNKAR